MNNHEKKNSHRVLLNAICAAVIAVATYFAVTLVIIPNSNYNAAVKLMEKGKYEEAIAAFEELDDYKDSADKIEECNAAILETDYNNAIALMDEGNYEEAIFALETLDGYKDSADKIRECGILKIQIGDYITFGSYEQDNDISNGKEDIEWLVLDREDNKILVISKYGLDAKQYNVESNSTSTTNTDSGSAQTQQSEEKQSTFDELLSMAYEATGGMRNESHFVTWENCTLRSWMNSDFYDAAFSASEKQAIVQTTVSADKNPEYDTNPGNDTMDNVFLLSINEVNKYFSSENASQCAATDYAIAHGARPNSNYKVDGSFSSWWWLRSPGCNQSQAAFVDRAGSVYYYGDFVNFDKGCVRPALWINVGA